MGMMLRRRHNTNNNNTGVTTLNAVTPNIKNTPIDSKKPENEPEIKEKKITRADIMKMNVAQVRAYAETQGIEGANAISGAELKRQLVDRMFEEDIENEE